jgi:hypothetical protein
MYKPMNCSAVKVSKAVPLGAKGEGMHSSYSFVTSALDRGEWSASFTPG